MSKATLKVSADKSVRVDKYLAEIFPEYSRAAITKLFTLKLIKLNGEPIQPGFKLKPGAEIEYDLGPLQEKPEVIELPIIYEDDDVIVVNKPAGIISHARGKFWQEASVASFIRNKLSEDYKKSLRLEAEQGNKEERAKRTSSTKSERETQVDEVMHQKSTAQPGYQDGKSTSHDFERGGIVHRLDRATSGVMICAKNVDTLKFLQKQFSDRSVVKKYIAYTENKPEDDIAEIQAPIERNAKDPKMFQVSATGKPATTDYTVLSDENNYTTVELIPKTGRTHQLRIHLAYIGCPIIGDELYGGKPNTRLLLHAKELTIKLRDSEIKTFVAPLPGDFTIDAN